MPRRRSDSEASRPEVLAFLSDIKAHPEDDTPRLVLADWLEEHGNEEDLARGEFLRLQCQRARLPPDDPRQQPLREREAELLETHRTAWLGPLQTRVREHTFVRGLCRATFSSQMLTHANWSRVSGCEALAWCDGLTVQRCGRTTFEQLLHIGILAGINCLKLRTAHPHLSPSDVCRLATCPDIANLTDLDLGDNLLGPEGLRNLLDSPYLGRLRGLNLWANHLGVEGMRLLSEWPGLARLRSLAIPYNDLHAEGMEMLAGSPYLPSPATLELWSNDIGTAGARALVATPLLRNLQRLDLPYSELDDEGVGVLVNCPDLAGISELYLFCNRIGDEGASALANSPWLRNLEVLHLDSNQIGTRGAQALAESPWLEGVRELRICAASNRLNALGQRFLSKRFGSRVTT
jgi:uncharacterized protein (TIGR02996 family)